MRSDLAIGDDALVLLCVGRMVPKKGFDYLIRALASPLLAGRDVVAVMVGEGDEWAAWQKLAAELGVAEKMRWTGNVPKDRISVYYNLADALVMPSVSTKSRRRAPTTIQKKGATPEPSVTPATIIAATMTATAPGLTVKPKLKPNRLNNGPATDTKKSIVIKLVTAEKLPKNPASSAASANVVSA